MNGSVLCTFSQVAERSKFGVMLYKTHKENQFYEKWLRWENWKCLRKNRGNAPETR